MQSSAASTVAHRAVVKGVESNKLRNERFQVADRAFTTAEALPLPSLAGTARPREQGATLHGVRQRRPPPQRVQGHLRHSTPGSSRPKRARAPPAYASTASRGCSRTPSRRPCGRARTPSSGRPISTQRWGSTAARRRPRRTLIKRRRAQIRAAPQAPAPASAARRTATTRTATASRAQPTRRLRRGGSRKARRSGTPHPPTPATAQRQQRLSRRQSPSTTWTAMAMT